MYSLLAHELQLLQMVDLRPLIKRAAILTRQLKDIRDLLSNISVEEPVINAKLQEATILKVILHSLSPVKRRDMGLSVSVCPSVRPSPLDMG